MAKLAIRHETRSNEVIELLEMLGGKNSKYCIGNNPNSFYFIDDDNAIDFYYLKIPSNYTIFTLEEFLEKFPYKVGDEVIAYAEGRLAHFTIQDIRWNNKLNKIEYKICSSWYDTSLMQPYKEEIMEEKIESFEILESHCKDEVKIEFDPLKFEMVEIENGYYVVRKKPEYPKTFIEVLDFWHPNRQLEDDYQRDYKKDLIEKFQDLLYARDAYWKIAGNWEPNWSEETDKFTISNKCNKIYLNNTAWYSEVLAFPTAEMRDTFYENFKDLIKECKELL